MKMKTKQKINGSVIGAIVITAAALLLAGCGFLAPAAATDTSIRVAAGPDDLDEVIREASDELNEYIPAGNFIGFINIQSASAALSEYVIDELIRNAVRDRNFTVLDRQRLEEIRAEQNLQYSGEVDDKFALEIGRLIGIQTIVTGTINPLGSRYRMTIRALNVQTGAVQVQFNRNISAGETVTALMNSQSSAGNVSGALASRGQVSGGSAQAASASSAGAEIGVYTFYPRLRPTRAGLNVNNIFIPQITVTKDFIVIHFCRNAEGAWDIEGGTSISGFYDARNFILQNLDNPSQFFTPASAQSTNNGMGGIWALSYRRFNATRLKLEGKQYGSDQQPFVFEEIILGAPDR